MYNVDYNLQGARVTKTNYIMEWWLVSLFCVYENHYELELSSALFSYDICHVEHYYNTLYGSYTIAELILLHISSWTILLTFWSCFWLFFYVSKWVL